MATHSKGTATWAGDLMGGHGTVSAGNGGFTTLPTTWAARAESRATGTSPEELLAAAHASCFSMAFAGSAPAGTGGSRRPRRWSRSRVASGVRRGQIP